MSLSSSVHTHVHVVLLTALKTYSVNYFLILMTIFFKLDNETKLNLNHLKWEGKYNRTKRFIHTFYSAIKEKIEAPQIDIYDQYLINLVMIIKSVNI